MIGRLLTGLLAEPETRAGIVALSKVDPQSDRIYKDSTAKGLNAEVDFVTSASGEFRDIDSLMLIVDKSRFGIEAAVELHRFAGIAANFNVAEPDSAEFGALGARSPLAVKLSDLSTGKTFWVIVNHLARGEADLRTDQVCEPTRSANRPGADVGEMGVCVSRAEDLRG